MKRPIINTCLTLPLLILALLLAVQSVAYDAGYIARELFKLGSPQVLGMSEEDVNRYAKQTAEYLRGTLSEPNVRVTVRGQEVWLLNEREVLHMQDVRHLFLLARYAAGLLLLFFLLLGIIAYRRRQLPCYFRVLSGSAVGGIVITAFLALLVTQDFNSYFTQFHLISFSNDLWLLNPATDRLINLLPEQFFANAAGQTAIRAVVLLLMLAFGGYWALRQYKRRAL